MEGKHKILGTNPNSEEIISFIPYFRVLEITTVLEITLSRTAMFWLRYCITLMSLVNTYN